MLKIHTLTLGAYQTNCYIVHEASSKACCIIDPGYEPDTILRKVADLGLTVDAVLLTHGHFDHVGGVEAIVKATGCALFLNAGDCSMSSNPIHAHFYPIANRDFPDVCFCGDLEKISAAGLTFTVLTTPGHTAGSVCYLADGVIFSGDTLFAGSCGRTDLPGGDPSAMRRSLERLAGLEGDFAIYPGHGESTTLAQEKRYNPYLR